jgi:signal transduction histidine kinase
MRATTLLVDREVAAAQAALRPHANSEALRRGDFAEVHRETTAMNADMPWTWTLLIDRDGSPVLNTLVPYGTHLPGKLGSWVARIGSGRRRHADGATAVIEVSDTGIGIAPATLPLIFEALVQGPSPSTGRRAAPVSASRSCASWRPCTAAP